MNSSIREIPVTISGMVMGMLVKSSSPPRGAFAWHGCRWRQWCPAPWKWPPPEAMVTVTYSAFMMAGLWNRSLYSGRRNPPPGAADPGVEGLDDQHQDGHIQKQQDQAQVDAFQCLCHIMLPPSPSESTLRSEPRLKRISTIIIRRARCPRSSCPPSGRCAQSGRRTSRCCRRPEPLG